MKEAFKSQQFYIILSVLYVITGIVILIWPNMTMPLLGKALGIGMLVVGFTHIIVYFTKDHFATILHMDLTIGVVFAAFGAFMLMHADFVEMAIPFGVGILLLIGAMTKIQYALDMKRMYAVRWKIMLVLALILAVLGIVLLYNPFSATVLLYVIAISVILDGILNIFCVLFLSHRMKQISRGKYPAPMPQNVPQPGPVQPGAPAQPMPPAPPADVFEPGRQLTDSEPGTQLEKIGKD